MRTPIARVPKEYYVDEETGRKLDELKLNKEQTPKTSKVEIPEWLEKKRAILEAFAASRGLNFAEIEEDTNCLRYCYVCRLIKPDRCHHCRACGFCVLRYDHHCPYIYKCISYSNYKFFLLLLFYGAALAIWTISTEIQGLVYHFMHGALYLGIQLVVGLIFQLLGGIFVIDVIRFHVSLTNTNDTTCENDKVPYLRFEGASYDMGIAQNWKYLLGRRLWILPVSTRYKDDN
uniref:Palmitoyltransferase n=1 Tax=Acrobeloides nanus TaxID=290746 RepID=A0A914E3H3_9BILA